jgi:hypothetical protein
VTAPPTNPAEVVRGLSTLTERLYQHVRSYADAEKEAVQLRQAADIVEARAFLRAEGSVDAKKRQAALDAEDAEGKALVAEAVVRTLKAKIRAIETDIDVHRTFGATVRAELKTLGYGEAP